MVVSSIVVPVVSALTQKKVTAEYKARVEETFACYDEE